jgi:hypothetical protein
VRLSYSNAIAAKRHRSAQKAYRRRDLCIANRIIRLPERTYAAEAS